MKSVFLFAGAISFLSMGCGHSLMQPPIESADDVLQAPADPAGAGSPEDALLGDFITGRAGAYDFLYASRRDPDIVPRAAGDHVVYRFSGQRLERPVTLTQRVVGRKGMLLLVDQVLDDGREAIHLRLRIRDESAGMNRIVSVARVANGVQLPFGTMTYQALMDRIVPPIEATEGRLGSAHTIVDVAGTGIECEKTTYRVRVSGEPAFLTALQSSTFAWGDIGGEIRDGHGRLLYKAEIVELSGSQARPEVARGELAAAPPDPYEGLDDEPAASAARPSADAMRPARVAAQADFDAYEQWDELE